MIRILTLILLFAATVEVSVHGFMLADIDTIEVCDMDEGEKESEKEQKEDGEKDKYFAVTFAKSSNQLKTMNGNSWGASKTSLYYMTIPSPPPEIEDSTLWC